MRTMNMMFRNFLIVCCFFSWVTWVGCGELDSQEKLEDLRVLAVRVEPPDIRASFNHFLARIDNEEIPSLPIFPETDVSVEILALDPRGGPLTLNLQNCPKPVGNACNRFDVSSLRSSFAQTDLDAFNAFFQPRFYERELLEEDLENDPSGRIPVPTYNLSFSRDIIDSILGTTQSVETLAPERVLDLLQSEYAYIGIVARNSSVDEVAQEIATKRIPVAIDPHDPLLLPILDQSFNTPEGEDLSIIDFLIPGATLCPLPDAIPESEGDDPLFQGTSTCLYPRPANKNPTLVGFNWLSEEDDPDVLSTEEKRANGEIFVDTRSEFTKNVAFAARAGEQIRLRPVFESGAEFHQVFLLDPNAFRLELVNRLEDFAGSHYVTRGSTTFLRGPQFDGNLDFTWTLPEDAQPGESDVLIIVYRDQRGGTDWGQVKVTYTN